MPARLTAASLYHLRGVVLSSVYYSVLSEQLAAFSSTDPDAAMPVWKTLLELLRDLASPTFLCAWVVLEK